MLRPRVRFAVQAGSVCLALLALTMCANPARADGNAREDLPQVFEKFLPEGVQDLRTIQAQVKKVVDRVLPCTVALQIGKSQGSGVIINKEGYILTAGHVSGQPGRTAQIVLHDGRKLKGITLGADTAIDSGLVKITQEGAEFPHVDMGHSADLKKGQWVIALGHPGGYQVGRPPVVRVGRILEATAKHLRSDCALVGGDSGGPLFDMTGEVIGIHSRIGGSITFNIHVPVDTYTETWDRLAASEVWGSPFNFLGLGKLAQGAYLGIRPDPDSQLVKILSVTPNSPAARAGLQADDVILRFDDYDINSVGDLDNLMRARQPGNEITLQLRRGSEQVTVTVTLGKRPAE
jgi:serine protease Do